MRSAHFVSIVVANYNGERYLETCLKSVLLSGYQDYELLVVDDGSSDKSVNIIKSFQKRYKKITLLKNSHNLGAAKSRNKAIKIARGKIVVFLDNDTEVTPDWLGKLLEPLLSHKEMGASQAVILDFSNRDSIQMAGGLLIPQTGWLIPFNQWEKYSKIRPTLGERNIVAISAALAVKKEVIDKIGGFDEKEAIYTEDLDFCWRIWLAGYRIVLAPNSCVFHWTKSVDARSGMKASYKQIYFHLAKNSFRSIIKNYEVINILKYLPVSIFINIGRGFIFLLSKRKSDALAGSLESIMWLFSNLSDTIRKRREVQRERRFSDKFLMEKIFLNENLINVYNKHFK